MNITLFLIFFGISILFFALGILFARGKGTWLIAGYNTLSDAEKASWDEAALCRCMSRFLYVLAACWLIPTVGAALENVLLICVGTGIFIAATLGGVVWLNSRNRCRR